MFDDLLPIAKTEFSDHHAPLPHKVRCPMLRAVYPIELRAVTRMAKEKSTEHMQEIKRVGNAEAQYALLLHYHRVLGTIPRTQAAAKPITINEEVTAYNLFMSGKPMAEIAKELNRGISTIWRTLTGGKPKTRYHHITTRVGAIIIELYAKGNMPLSIAKQLNLPYRAVRAQIYERKGR